MFNRWFAETGPSLAVGGVACLNQDSDWTIRTAVEDIPKSAKFVRIWLSMDQATGIADFDDVKISVVEENK
jgi:hypothetical protein